MSYVMPGAPHSAVVGVRLPVLSPLSLLRHPPVHNSPIYLLLYTSFVSLRWLLGLVFEIKALATIKARSKAPASSSRPRSSSAAVFGDINGLHRVSRWSVSVLLMAAQLCNRPPAELVNMTGAADLSLPTTVRDLPPNFLIKRLKRAFIIFRLDLHLLPARRPPRGRFSGNSKCCAGKRAPPTRCPWLSLSSSSNHVPK
jgi:hypothetical protein